MKTQNLYLTLLSHIRCKNTQIFPMDKVKRLLSFKRSQKHDFDYLFVKSIKKITIFAENMSRLKYGDIS